MGPLEIPITGLVYVDAQAIIYSVEKRQPYARLLEPFWIAVQTGTAQAVTSNLSILETLVIPIRLDDAALASRYEGFFGTPGLATIKINDAILREAARLRAKHRKLKSPDAIHIASALHVGATAVVTNDRDFETVGLHSVIILDDLVASP